MAEVKNAFIKSKMNKDLDARLIPQGEYRDAVNIQVSKSEGDDVGALENVLGNVSRADFEADSGVPNLTCIGYFANESDSKVYLFFTDYTDPYNTPTPTYNPSANNFIYQCDLSSNPNPTGPAVITKLVKGAFLNFSTNRPIIGVNILEDFLFFTDNRNQPRKINVSFALSTVIPATYYVTEDNISIAKYYPYEPILLIKPSLLADASGEDECAMYDAFSEFIPLNQGSGGVPTGLNVTNPYYESNFPGDPQFLEDKFVRFSYRFKFDDGEYSLIAPFTQPCFIPKQDGYFLEGDEQQTFGSTIVEFMENKVNKIDLQIPLPVAADNLSSDFHVSEIDIIYKESDGLALQVVETIPINDIAGTDPVFEYVYLSQKPYKTLPEDEITRVYDKVPVKALGQEIISNRVVYSNFQNKHTPPNFIKYQVGANQKYSPSDSTPYTQAKTTIEYPNQTLKQNRNYQVGVVLSDRYGRQSTVILSNDQNASVGGFGADTIYLPYRNINDSITYLGDSLKLSFNEAIQSNKNETSLTPGLYNSDINNSSYNPLGWQTFKIVVKQIQQEYYNVYTAGAIKGLPVAPTGLQNFNTSFVTLINDNINKVPRDLSEVGPQDKTFRSSVKLFGRVENTVAAFSNIGNEQYLSNDDRVSFTTNNIEDLFDLFDVGDFSGTPGNKPIIDDTNPYYPFFKSESNPFVAEFVTSQNPTDQFGVENISGTGGNYPKIENLTIFETAPTVSKIDLYYETSTSGLIEDLNAAVGSSSGGATQIGNWQYFQDESFAIGDAIVSGFEFLNFGAQPLNGTAVLISVIDNSGSTTNRASQFSLVSLGGTQWELQTNALFYYGANAGTDESYEFTFQFTFGTTVTTLPVQVGNLANVDPTINNSNANPIQLEVGDLSVLPNLSGVNGTADPTKDTDGLTFSIDSQTGAGTYVVVNNNEVQNNDSSANGSGTFTLRLTDAGSPQVGTTTKTFDVVFDQPTSNFPQETVISDFSEGSGAAIYFTPSSSSGFTNNINATIFQNTPSYNSQGNNTNRLLIGLTQNPSVGTSVISVCDPTITSPTSPLSPTPGFLPGFINKRNTFSLTDGKIYIYINPWNQEPFSTFPFSQSQTTIRYQIAYRANSSSNWTTAVDLNGDTVDFAGSWIYDNSSDEGLTSGSLQSSVPAISLSKVENNTNRRYAGLVYAFDQVGEYRILHGNYITTFGTFTSTQFPANNFSCSTTPFSSVNTASYIEYGDFNYPATASGGPDENIGPASGSLPTVFRYQINQSSCSSSFSSIANLFAREPLAKYVTQLYTNSSLTTKYTGTATGTDYRIRRMKTTNTSSLDVANPEYTKDGTYVIRFSNSTGLVVPGSQTPCFH
jgi:hypothetical protein